MDLSQEQTEQNKWFKKSKNTPRTKDLSLFLENNSFSIPNGLNNLRK